MALTDELRDKILADIDAAIAADDKDDVLDWLEELIEQCISRAEQLRL